MAIVVAVDGPAASGKGTLCRQVARELQLAYLDTGSLYRATALRLLRKYDETTAQDHHMLVSAAAAAKVLTPEDLADPDLRTEKVGQFASIISTDPAVRRALLDFQRAFCASPPAGARGVVLDGRDIGTVICPEAAVKFFLTADLATRARRRHSELAAAGVAADLQQVERDMQQRDHRDATRAGAPMQPAVDALVMDTSGLTAEETMTAAMAHIRLKMPGLFHA
jgi:cytidylate kinase